MHTSSRSRRKEITHNNHFSSNNGEIRFRQASAASTTNCSVEENSFALAFRNRSSKGDRGGVPIKRLLDEEVSNQMEIKHSSPGLIARLMGLDTLPPQSVNKNDKNSNSSNKKVAAYERFQRNSSPVEKNSWPRSTNEEKQFKDVFEVRDVLDIRKHKVHVTRMEAISSKRSEVDINLIRQKFTDVKRLSTDEALRNSKEFNDALEILDSNKDLLLEFLQDPNSLLGKYLQDVNEAQNPSRSEITLLRSSKGAKCRNNEVWSKFGKHLERCPQPQNVRKPSTIQSFKEHNQSIPHKLSTSRQGDKHEPRAHSTRIVVLKPSLEKAQTMLCDSSETHEKFQNSSRKYKETSVSSGKRPHMEGGRGRFKPFENVAFLDKKTKTSKEIARQVARQMNHVVNMNSENVMFSELNAYIGNDKSSKNSDFNGVKVSDSFSQLPHHFDMWNEGLCSPSMYSTEPLVRREATQHSSERWKTTPCFQEVGLTAEGSSTLGDMLAFCNRQATRSPVEFSDIRKTSGEKFANEGLGSWDFPLGISSKDGWFLQSSRILSRSKSLPSSTGLEIPGISNSKQIGGSESCCTLKEVLEMSPDDLFDSNFSKWARQPPLQISRYGTSKRQNSHTVGDEKIVPEREIHVNSEELRKSIHVRHFSEEIPSHSASSEELIQSASDYIRLDETHPSINSDEQVKQFVLHVPSEKGELSGEKHSDGESEEISTAHPMDQILPQKEGRNQSALSSNELEQPSPVSVLEPQSEEESSSSGCFDRVSADLQELRMQLKLLKLESNTYTEDDMDVSSSSCEQIEASNQLAIPVAETIPAFRNEEERDFSYLLDILIDSGISCANQDTLSGFCYSGSCQVDPCVFDKLEKKYGDMVSWSRCERMLLFDLIKCTLAGLETPCMNLHTWNREGFVEGLWQTVVKQRKDIGSIIADKILDPRWIALDENIDIIVTELERMLNDDLLQEIVNEFIRVSLIQM